MHRYATTAKKDYEEEKEEHEKEKKKLTFETHSHDLEHLIYATKKVYGYTFFPWNTLRI